jgi:hypothetical protein
LSLESRKLFANETLYQLSYNPQPDQRKLSYKENTRQDQAAALRLESRIAITKKAREAETRMARLGAGRRAFNLASVLPDNR